MDKPCEVLRDFMIRAIRKQAVRDVLEKMNPGIPDDSEGGYSTSQLVATAELIAMEKAAWRSGNHGIAPHLVTNLVSDAARALIRSNGKTDPVLIFVMYDRDRVGLEVRVEDEGSFRKVFDVMPTTVGMLLSNEALEQIRSLAKVANSQGQLFRFRNSESEE